MTGWIFVILTSFCSVLLAHLFKITEHTEARTTAVLTVNYAFATLFALLISLLNPDVVYAFSNVDPPIIILGIITGVVFIVNFFAYSKSVYLNGVGVSVAAMRVSLLIPVLLSTIWYLEPLLMRQWAGVILVFFALILLLPNKRNLLNRKLSAGWLLLVLFILTGFGDSALKVYEVDFSMLLVKELFMAIVFTTAFITGLIYFFSTQKTFFTKKEIWLGCCIGLPNLLTAIFLIAALEVMNGAVAYSAVNVLTVLGGTLLGLVRWKDKYTRLQLIGIIITIVSVLLLVDP
jgi:drug/metabolite transporter (DMT)-like permease